MDPALAAVAAPIGGAPLWWSALLAALLAGLLGGVHCIGMCGGIAGALGAVASGSPRRALGGPSTSASRGSPPGSSWGLRLVAFNAGRIGSYATAGALAGALGGVATLLVPLHGLRIALFVAAQAMLIMLGLYIAGWTALFPRLEALGGAMWRKMAPLRRRFVPVDSHPKALAAGALWGWVPCGMVYGMLPFAMAAGSPASGAAILAMFGIGTLPGVLVAGVAGARFGAWRQHVAVRRTAGALVIGLAAFGLAHLPATAELLAYAWVCLPN